MDRKAIIQSLRDKRYSYKSIGSILGISRQRVHQLLTGYKSPFSFKKLDESYLRKEERMKTRAEKNRIIGLRKKAILEKVSENLNHNKEICRDVSRGLEGREYTREMVRARDDYTCQSCGKVWEKGSRRFDVHHKDCDKDKTRQYDNYEKEKENLITLCHKCHLTLHFIIRDKARSG